MTGETDDATTIQEDSEFLAGDETVEEPDFVKEEEPEEEEPIEEPSEEEEKETKLPEEIDEVKDPSTAEAAKAIAAKYPNLFKEFPDLRKALFQYGYYSNVFPTVELAKEAAGKVSHFEALAEKLIDGDSGDLLDSIYDIDNVGPAAVSKIVENFLPTVLARSESLWRKAIDPVFRNTILEMRNQARREKNATLWHTANNVAIWLYGDKNVTPPTKPQLDPEKEDLKRQLGHVASQQEQNFVNGMITELDSNLSKEINGKIDASVPEGFRSLLVEKVIKEIKQIMAKNQEHRDLINRLGEQAKRAGFSAEHRKAILAAYLRPARGLIASVLSKNANGIKLGGNGKPEGGKTKPTGDERAVTGGKVDASKIDWRKTSDKDFLADKVVMKR